MVVLVSLFYLFLAGITGAMTLVALVLTGLTAMHLVESWLDGQWTRGERFWITALGLLALLWFTGTAVVGMRWTGMLIESIR